MGPAPGTHVDDAAGHAGLIDAVLLEPEDLAALEDEPAAAPAGLGVETGIRSAGHQAEVVCETRLQRQRGVEQRAESAEGRARHVLMWAPCFMSHPVRSGLSQNGTRGPPSSGWDGSGLLNSFTTWLNSAILATGLRVLAVGCWRSRRWRPLGRCRCTCGRRACRCGCGRYPQSLQRWCGPCPAHFRQARWTLRGAAGAREESAKGPSRQIARS